jgi:hypothetical protein
VPAHRALVLGALEAGKHLYCSAAGGGGLTESLAVRPHPAPASRARR